MIRRAHRTRWLQHPFGAVGIDSRKISVSGLIPKASFGQSWPWVKLGKATFFFSNPNVSQGLPWQPSGKESAWLCRRSSFDLSVRKIPWRRKWQPTPVLLPGKSHGQRSLVGYNTAQEATKESDRTERLNNNICKLLLHQNHWRLVETYLAGLHL